MIQHAAYLNTLNNKILSNRARPVCWLSRKNGENRTKSAQTKAAENGQHRGVYSNGSYTTSRHNVCPVRAKTQPKSLESINGGRLHTVCINGCNHFVFLLCVHMGPINQDDTAAKLQ